MRARGKTVLSSRAGPCIRVILLLLLLIPFMKPITRVGSGKGKGTFNFLGFTFFWSKGLATVVKPQKPQG